MPTDADFMYSQLQVPFAINPYPIVTGPAYMNASQTLISESGDILLDGKIVNSNTTNIPQLNFDSSKLNVSATSVNINGSLTNSKVSTNVPSIWFNGSNVNMSCTLLSSNGGMSLTNLNSDPGIPYATAQPTSQSWATAGRVYVYEGKDSNNNLIKYLCVV